MSKLETVIVNPRGAHGTVIWMHGLGASGNDFEPIVPHLGLPEVRFVFPHAPVRKVTINAGYAMRAWYDITTLGESASRENADHIHDATRQIESLIADEYARGVSSERLVIAGFSQGAAMALHVGQHHAHKLAGIMCLSGYLLLEGQAPLQSENTTTPMLFCHGEFDDVVPSTRGKRAFKHFEQTNPNCEWHTYPMGHEVCPPQIRTIREWFHGRLD